MKRSETIMITRAMRCDSARQVGADRSVFFRFAMASDKRRVDFVLTGMMTTLRFAPFDCPLTLNEMDELGHRILIQALASSSMYRKTQPVNGICTGVAVLCVTGFALAGVLMQSLQAHLKANPLVTPEDVQVQ